MLKAHQASIKGIRRHREDVVKWTEVLLYVWGGTETRRSVAAHCGKTRRFVLIPGPHRQVRESHAMMVTEMSSPPIPVALEHMDM
jgi:hypothetical protein